MKHTRILSGLLALIMLLSVTACDGGTQGEKETDADTTVATTEQVTGADTTQAVTPGEEISYITEVVDGYAMTSSAGKDSQALALDASTSVAGRFTAQKDVEIKTFSFMLTEAGFDDTFTLAIYKWNTDYATSVSTAPVFESTIVSPAGDYLYYGMRRTFDITEGTVGEGEWLYVLTGGETAVNIALCSKAEADANARITVGESYLGGVENEKALYGFMNYSAPESVKEPTENGYTQLTAGKAHVILIAGQSNAAGRSNAFALSTTMGGKNAARYRNGYENIKISYMADNNVSVDFVPVTTGQGAEASTYFGPELGLADYLATAYPDEEFYIIKVAVSGSIIYSQWKENGNVYPKAVAHIEAALGKLKAQGLDPEIFALCWMQGESDAEAIERAVTYVDNMEDLLGRLEAKFADNIAPNGMALLDASIYHAYIWPFAGIVNASKQMIDARSQNRYFLDTNALDIETEHEANDRAHYDSDDMIALGELFGKGIETVLGNAGYGK